MGGFSCHPRRGFLECLAHSMNPRNGSDYWCYRKFLPSPRAMVGRGLLGGWGLKEGINQYNNSLGQLSQPVSLVTPERLRLQANASFVLLSNGRRRVGGLS